MASRAAPACALRLLQPESCFKCGTRISLEKGRPLRDGLCSEVKRPPSKLRRLVGRGRRLIAQVPRRLFGADQEVKLLRTRRA